MDVAFGKQGMVLVEKRLKPVDIIVIVVTFFIARFDRPQVLDSPLLVLNDGDLTQELRKFV
jgi:hypothetical protein